MAVATTAFREGNPELRIRASELLFRYPDIDDNELQELRVFYTTAPAIDTALLTCDPALIPKIMQFETEQKAFLKRRTPLGLLIGIILLFSALLVYEIWVGGPAI